MDTGRIIMGAWMISGNVSSAFSAAKKAEAHHQSPFWAATKSLIKNNWLNALFLGTGTSAFIGAQLLMMSPALAHLATGVTQMRNEQIRTAALPMSHTFEASEWAWKSQQRGLQTMGQANQLGSEAGAFARRYARRT